MDKKAETNFEMQDFKDPGYEIFIIFVSVLSVLNLVLIWIPGFDPDAVHVVEVINFFLTIIFLMDFTYRLLSAGSKHYYFFRDWGWADLLASIPALRILRLFRIFKAYRLLKKYGVHNIAEQLKKHRANSMFYIVIFCVILVIEVGAFLVLVFEQSSPAANIQTASDALWWTCVTITTVGYGDRFPTTNAGRLVGIAIMAMGVALIGTLAGFIANKLLAPDMSDTDEKSPKESSATGVVEGIHNALKEQHRENVELQERLERIEQHLKGKSP
ncbi:MAG: ion transporter [Methanoregula sp.]